MRCISLHQPWATLCVIGAKPYETRDWSTNYRGPLLIHAAQKFTRDVRNMCLEKPFCTALQKAGMTDVSDMPLGAIVGVVTLKEVWQSTGVAETFEPGVCYATIKHGFSLRPHTRTVHGDALAFGDFYEGRFAWELADASVLSEPYPWCGRQNFFNVPDDVVAELLEQRDGKWRARS